jgi:hypothetical protein
MKHLLFLTLALAGLPAAAGEALPLEMGNFWNYRDAATGQTFTIRVGTPVAMQSGRVYHFLHGYTPERVLARINEAGDLALYDEEAQEEKILTAFSATAGDWWNAPGRECALQGHLAEKRATYAGQAGRWNRVIDVQFRTVQCADAGPEREQFAENIGMLRRVVNTIAGPRTYDLVYARIGSQIIENRDRGRFTVSVDQPLDQPIWQVSLRLDIGYVPGIRLPFATGQEYDIAVRDGEGKIVWKWSDGRVFDQGLHERTLGNIWNVSVEIPRPAGSVEGYTIEGWLTTAGDGPKFAATAPAPPPRGPDVGRQSKRDWGT